MTISNRLSQMMNTDQPYLTDGGLETWLIFERGFELPAFAAFPLLRQDEGRAALVEYFAKFLDVAEKAGRGFVLDTPTWRAGVAWCDALGLSAAEIMAANKDAVALAKTIRDARETSDLPVVINGQIGPAGDAYDGDRVLGIAAAEKIHAPQIAALAEAGADLVSALTLGTTSEAIGIAHAAIEADIPFVVSFTTETDGKLPNGTTLADAIREVDNVTGGAPLYYMINCAHPDHFRGRLEGGGADWLSRIRGVRANASRLSHAELDEATQLDAGDPIEFGALSHALGRMLPNLSMLGGCCGTDHRHVHHIAAAAQGGS